MVDDEALTLSTVDVARFAGLSYRRADFYVRVGLLVPPVAARGSGTQRRFSTREARIAWVVGRVQDDHSRDTATLASAVITLRHAPVWGGLLVTNGVTSTVVEHAAELLDALAEMGPTVLVVDLDSCPDPAAVLS